MATTNLTKSWWRRLLSNLLSIRLLPTNRQFYELFQEHITEIIKSSELLLSLVQNGKLDPEKIKQLHREIKESETKGDQILRQLTELCNNSITTPFPRQDILNLTNLLDDILDGIEGAADNYLNYSIAKKIPDVEKMAEIIVQGANLLPDLILALKKFRHPLSLYDTIRDLEHQADDINKSIIPKSYLDINSADNLEELKSILVYAIAIDKIVTKMEKTADSLRHVATTIKGVIAKRV